MISIKCCRSDSLKKVLGECDPASPGSVPSTRPGVGLSALSERRRSTGARVPFSQDAAALWPSPSITATEGRDTNLVGQTDETKGQQLCDTMTEDQAAYDVLLL